MTDLSTAETGSETPTISVVVPVLNEERYLGRTLEILSRQTYPEARYEVLVVDGGSTDSTVEIADALALSDSMIRVLQNPGRWSSRGRNVGIRVSTGEYILIVDGHCLLRDLDYLEKVAQLFAATGADCLGRPQPLEFETALPLQKAIAIARTSPIGHHADSLIYSSGETFAPAISVAVAYRRSVFTKVGLFDEAFDACEDVEFNYRVDQAGLRCFFSDQIAVPYVPRSSLLDLSRQLMRYGRGRARLLRKHPGTFSLKSLAPGLSLASLVLGVVLSTFVPLFAWVLALGLGLYLGAILLISAGSARKAKPWWVALLVPPCLVTTHFSTGLGTLVEVLSWFGETVRPNRQTTESHREKRSDSNSQA